MNHGRFLNENGIHPHAWRRFDLAQMNMLRFCRSRVTKSKRQKNNRRARKWALEMSKWLDRIYYR